jgi:TPR repeat protein
MKQAALAMLMSCCLSSVHADTLNDAMDARDRGDFEAAYPLWVSLAEQGDDKAAIEVGLMYHQGQGVPKDYAKAMDWYLSVFRKNGDAWNNIGVMYRDGQGVTVNRKIAYVLFLTVHMTGMGSQSTIMRANRNLRREMEELSLAERQEAICWTMQYVVAYVEARGDLAGIPEDLRPSAERKRIKDLDWWAPGEVAEFTCPQQ